MNRKKVQSGLPWIVAGLLILTVTLYGSFNPAVRAFFVGDAKKPGTLPEPAKPVDAGDDAPQIEAKLRKEYDLRLKSSLAKELEKARALDEKMKEPPSAGITLEMPRGIVTDITQLSTGIPLRTEVVYGAGDTAIVENRLEDSYTATYQLKFRIPRAATSVSEIEKATPGLSKILPGFAGLFTLGSVSPWHETIYRNKIAELRRNSSRLGELLTKSNAYDCNTVLHLISPKGRKVFFMQADMNAIVKGSDGDRAPEMPASQVDSIGYDPFTAYSWPKTGKKPNPMIAGWERRIAIGSKELGDPAITPERKAWIGERITKLKEAVESMKKRSYLISAYDPYIVLPIGVLTDTKDPFAPKVGDYAVVIIGGKIYPCIVGDAGSDTQVGEASARIALALVPKWNPAKKPVPFPGVSYVVFPGSREKDAATPDHRKWREKCLALLGDIGGFGDGIECHDWTIPPPAPAPAPAPAPVPVPVEGKPETPAKKVVPASPPKPAGDPEPQD